MIDSFAGGSGSSATAPPEQFTVQSGPPNAVWVHQVSCPTLCNPDTWAIPW